jgi:putative membrane protein
MPENFGPHLIIVIIYGVVTLLLVLLGVKIFDWITPRLDVPKELAENKNVAVAIVVAAIILGLCYLMAEVIK